MEIDVKAKIEELAKKIAGEKDLLAKFKKDPVGTVTKLLDIKLDDQIVQAIVKGIKAKLGMTGVKGILNKLLGK